jgi:DNA-nicking Smr family endonuclease
VDPHAVPIEPEFDLHPFAPADVAIALDEYLRAAHAAGLRVVRVVHGRGRGVQRARVQAALERHPLVGAFEDDRSSHLGATFVRLVDR